jgi:predicted nucleic acid-binding protein
MLECAAHTKWGYLVTGDKGLSSLENFEGIPIVTIADFMEIVWRQGKGYGP